jgi:hypothetical protein
VTTDRRRRGDWTPDAGTTTDVGASSRRPGGGSMRHDGAVGLTAEDRQSLVARLTEATHALAAGSGDEVELQLFGFGMRLVPRADAAILSWFLVPGRDDLIVSVDTVSRAPTDLVWHIDPSAPDAVDQVVALLHAGVGGRMTVGRGRHLASATAHLADGSSLTTTSRSSWLGRLVPRRRRPAVERPVAAHRQAGGDVRVLDAAAPPALVEHIRRGVAPVIEAAGLTVRDTFEVAGVHGLPSESGGAVFGWGTRALRADGTTAVWIWFDGIEEDLAVLVDERHWFEWRDPLDATAAHSEVVAVVTAALTGQLVPGPERSASVRLADRQVLTTGAAGGHRDRWADGAVTVRVPDSPA